MPLSLANPQPPAPRQLRPCLWAHGLRFRACAPWLLQVDCGWDSDGARGCLGGWAGAGRSRGTVCSGAAGSALTLRSGGSLQSPAWWLWGLWPAARVPLHPVHPGRCPCPAGSPIIAVVWAGREVMAVASRGPLACNGWPAGHGGRLDGTWGRCPGVQGPVPWRPRGTRASLPSVGTQLGPGDRRGGELQPSWSSAGLGEHRFCPPQPLPHVEGCGPAGSTLEEAVLTSPAWAGSGGSVSGHGQEASGSRVGRSPGSE